jgi:hypothetical protein
MEVLAPEEGKVLLVEGQLRLKQKSSRMLTLLLYYIGEVADHAIENQRTQGGAKKSRLFLSTGQGKPYSMGTSKAPQIKSHNIR